MRTIYKTVIEVEVLSEEPLNGNESINSILERTENDDLSGKFTTTVLNTPLTGIDAVNAIKGQGSDTDFFGMDEAGNEIDY